VEFLRLYPDERAAQDWFATQRWPDGPRCPRCGSDNVQSGTKHKTMPYRCRPCRRYFSVKTGTVMQDSKLGCQTWLVAMYLLAVGLKGQSSLRLHRDLGVCQKTAWYLAHRIRRTYGDRLPQFSGPVEVDETFIGGKRRNMPKAKREALSGRGTVDKAIVAGAKDRGTGEVVTAVVPNTENLTLRTFVRDVAEPGSQVFTDSAAAYQRMPEFRHEAVNHGVGEYVRGQAHTNGIESFWSMLKRAQAGTFHKISPKHLNRYVAEFAGKHNMRESDTLTQMRDTVAALVGRSLLYRDLVADNGLANGARS
jgi:transposase-like protein